MYFMKIIDVTPIGKGKGITKKLSLSKKPWQRTLLRLIISNLLILAFTSRDKVNPCSFLKHIRDCPPGHYCEDSSSTAQCM